MSTNREELHGLTDADLDAIARSPAARACMNEIVQLGLDQLARGQVPYSEAVFAELLGGG